MCDKHDAARIATVGGPTVLYIFAAKTLRAMLADANAALKLVDDDEAHAVREYITAIIAELSTRKD